MHAFDKRTDERTERSLKYRALHYMQLHRKNRSYLFRVADFLIGNEMQALL